MRGDLLDNIRRARIAWPDEDAAPRRSFAAIARAVAEANRARCAFEIQGFEEKMQAAWRGAECAGRFDRRADVGDGPIAARRELTMVAPLSDPETHAGGALELDPEGRTAAAARRRGSAILFPSFVLHRVTPVTRGARYSLTVWAHGAPFR